MYNYEQAYSAPNTSQPVFTPHAAQVTATAATATARSSNGGQIPAMTWNPPAPMDKHRQHPSFNNYMNVPRANSVQGMRLQQDLPVMPQPAISDHGSSQQPKLTTSFWEDEGTICYQVDARGICVARRQDNDMVNGTKLLNVVGMSRGKRDGILKNERGRVVVKVGAMHLKGVWYAQFAVFMVSAGPYLFSRSRITFSRAKALAAQYNITDLLQPLFADDPSICFYMNAPPPPPPLMAPLSGYYIPMGYPPQYAVRNNSNVAPAPEIPSMVPQDVYPYPSQEQSYVRRERPTSNSSQFRPPSASFHDPNIYSFEMEKVGSNHSLVDYASKAGGSSSVLSGISDSAPATPGSQQQYHSQFSVHPYDNSSTINTSNTAAYINPETTGAYGEQMDMYITQYYQQPSPHHNKWIDPPGGYHHQQQSQQTSW